MLAQYQDFTTDPALNLALEEALVDRAEQDIFLLWRDAPSVIIGRNQNALREINADYISENDLPVVRRLSGGGAVYHDLGNLCFTYIDPNGGGRQGDHSHFARPVVQALNRLGIPAEMQGRNDIAVDGRKISGNAQYIKKGKLCHHGTLLVDVDVHAMQSALRPDAAAIKGRGIDSVPARVRNLSAYRPDLTAQALAKLLLEDLLIHTNASPFTIDDALILEANRISERRYRLWEWNYGASPPYDYRRESRFPGGQVELCLRVEGGVIQSAAIYGDFLATDDISPLTRALTGIRHSRDSAESAIRQNNAAHLLGSVSLPEFLSLFP